MARRRRLEAPDQSELAKLNEGFAAKPPLGQSMTPPIAQVAGEAAAQAAMGAVTDRVAAAKEASDAKKWRAAETGGHAAVQISIDDIQSGYLRRDRLHDSAEERQELLGSIRQNGLRTPIEVIATDDGYGLISGHRRLQAFRALASEDAAFREIPAFVRRPRDSAAAYLNMVEENEIRANLSHYERGRIAALAAQGGVFDSVDAAVSALFEQASKSKRSKIRSFAAVHEALGDLLQFPTEMTERIGLKVAAGLRDGAQGQLREALSAGTAQNASAELKLLENALTEVPAEKDPRRGGRPSEVVKLEPLILADGGMLHAQVTAQGLKLELKGRALDPDEARQLLTTIQEAVEAMG
ncbi:ParB/RepB/Spo0J family partition protein [Cognatishimia sp. SS12]|uniref:ParB/RepB/Spo0J family partition protein n=1 Tax=Cognatishimia sp. SS12 TaxID=2979465 RepID=UPI00232FDC06|nr:ParB/RepB/Spo0J family partition protein [Cognatishimia sp. SS12]MDC0739439.1 ParB/RepB/Spo0J family partition protein [Cognatishimia sp. SS12]